ncbi:ABC transporter ATP-binding protein [Agrobacterium vitis]|uniref:ABC transporter ATP-binding protein n=1 Tax=Agrobacterium vitis TaxID=373 RepID=UPI0020348DF4|nr:sn-glycerol-3-phosphate ABC transporter ATP-binding protein UgpC [Agrobacterium vitis]MCM2471339.1 sn-glycerol-3-phosphate ABC transporter ATP-binding protein UgpC [Agrobacterium vitis]
MSNISVCDLDIGYGAVKVLENLQLDVKDGEFVVLLGPSGCGKSTLLNAIAGLTDVSGGLISIGGRDVTNAEPNERGLAMVFQSYALYPNMTVRGNLSYGLRIAGVSKPEIAQRVAETARFLQIGDYLDRRPANLSGGQRQRVAIGRAIIRKVDVFLFDEPLSNLDAKLRSELRVEIKRLHQNLKSTIIYVTHDQVEALTLADRIAVMKGGVIQQLDTPSEIYRRPANRFVASFIGSPTMNFLDGSIEMHGGKPVFLSGEILLPIDCYQANGTLPVGESVVFGFRPEHVTVGCATDIPGFNGEIDLIEPMGGETVVWAKVAGEQFAIKGDESLQSLPTGAVRLSPDLSKVSLFNRAGDRL